MSILQECLVTVWVTAWDCVFALFVFVVRTERNAVSLRVEFIPSIVMRSGVTVYPCWVRRQNFLPDGVMLYTDWPHHTGISRSGECNFIAAENQVWSARETWLDRTDSSGHEYETTSMQIEDSGERNVGCSTSSSCHVDPDESVVVHFREPSSLANDSIISPSSNFRAMSLTQMCLPSTFPIVSFDDVLSRAFLPTATPSMSLASSYYSFTMALASIHQYSRFCFPTSKTGERLSRPIRVLPSRKIGKHNTSPTKVATRVYIRVEYSSTIPVAELKRTRHP